MKWKFMSCVTFHMPPHGILLGRARLSAIDLLDIYKCTQLHLIAVSVLKRELNWSQWVSTWPESL